MDGYNDVEHDFIFKGCGILMSDYSLKEDLTKKEVERKTSKVLIQIFKSHFCMSVPPVQIFPDTNELKRFARNFVTTRIETLQKDVNHCLHPPYAPFPAILYCLSTIDLLGALLAGQASKRDPITRKTVNTTGNSMKYVRSFMGYTEDQTNLIFEIFRHKLVHLAQPKAVLSYKGKTICWQYEHDNTPLHLILQDLTPPQDYIIKTGWLVKIDQVFTLGISQFVQDIRDSVLRHGGYLDRLENVFILLINFRKAIEEAFSP
jgi:hypothetical protein